MTGLQDCLPLRGRWLRYFFAISGLLLVAHAMTAPRICWMGSVHPGAQSGAAKTQLGSFDAKLRLYIRERGGPPTTQQGLAALLTPRRLAKGVSPGAAYLEDVTAIPQDPWGNAFVYTSPGPRGESYQVISYGADGRPGGAGYDADLAITGP